MAACSMAAPCSEEEAGHGAPLPEPCHQYWSPSSNLWPCNCGVPQSLSRYVQPLGKVSSVSCWQRPVQSSARLDSISLK